MRRRLRIPVFTACVLVAAIGLPPGTVAAIAVVDPPTITLIDDQNQPLPGGLSVGQEFAAESAEGYPVGDPAETRWTCAVDFGDGTPASGFFRAKWPPAPCAQFHTYGVPGTYAITMTVTDPTGVAAQSSSTVVVTNRNVTSVDGGVEGSWVTVTGPPGSATYRWRAADTAHCVVDTPDTPSTRVACDDQGRYVFDVTGDSAATSGEYDVSYVNGPPAPVLTPVRGGVSAPRVGTGDQIVWTVDGRDPSWALADLDGPRFGDDLGCVFDFGDGTTADDADRNDDGCLGEHVYTWPGTYHATVTVDDGDGGIGAAAGTITVVPRDVHVRVSGRQPDGLRGVFRGVLTPDGIGGRMKFTTPQGRRVVVDRVDTLAVRDSDVGLQGTATVDGQAGYFVQADVVEQGHQVVLVTLVRGDRAQPPQTWTNVENVEGDQPWFERIVTARRVG